MTRCRLPGRRSHESREIVFRGQRFSVGIGRDRLGAPVECFVDARKTGSEYASLARDAGILLSLALQAGADLATIGRALTRDSSGEAASLLGAVVSEISEGDHAD